MPDRKLGRLSSECVGNDGMAPLNVAIKQTWDKFSVLLAYNQYGRVIIGLQLVKRTRSAG